MRILVTGGEGQLGNCITRAAKNSPDEYIFTDVDDLDITDPEAVRLGVKCNDFGAIVNCAGYTNVDKAEEQEDIARMINATATGYLARAAADNNIPLIHISTDYVFGGSACNTPLTELDPVNPLGAYGRTKLEGEQAVKDSGCRYIILRTAWLYSEFGHNFVKTMLRLTAEKPELKVVVDQVGSPTYAGDLAEAIVRMISQRLIDGNEGIYNYSNQGVCSWYDFTMHIAHMAGGREKCHITPCRSSEFVTKAERPAYSVLDKTKFTNTFATEIPYWVDSLATCIKNLTE